MLAVSVYFSNVNVAQQYIDDLKMEILLNPFSRIWLIIHIKRRYNQSIHDSEVASRLLFISSVDRNTWKKGQNGQRKCGRLHFCRKAAWNWKGITNRPMMTSASAKLAMKKLVTDWKKEKMPLYWSLFERWPASAGWSPRWRWRWSCPGRPWGRWRRRRERAPRPDQSNESANILEVNHSST